MSFWAGILLFAAPAVAGEDNYNWGAAGRDQNNDPNCSSALVLFCPAAESSDAVTVSGAPGPAVGVGALVAVASIAGFLTLRRRKKGDE